MPSPRSQPSINGLATDALKLSRSKAAKINATDVLWLYGAFARLVTSHEKLRVEHAILKRKFEAYVEQKFRHG